MRLHLSRDGARTDCGRNFRHTGGLRDTPHPAVLRIYRDPPCRPCFQRRAQAGDDLAKRGLERRERAEKIAAEG